MSDTEDRLFRVTWRSVSQVIGATEAIKERKLTAAYWCRDGALIVFKKADGAMVFTVTEALVETIEMLGDAEAKAAGGPIAAGQAYVVGDTPPGLEVLPREQIAEANREITINVTGSVIPEAQMATAIRRNALQHQHQHQRRQPPEVA